MLKIEHIGIAVRELSQSVPLFEKLLNASCYKQETVETEKVRTAFFQKGETKIELLESMDQEGVIAKYLDKKGEGLHHVAFELLDKVPREGADNKWVCFLHPRHTGGVLVELCMEMDHLTTKEST